MLKFDAPKKKNNFCLTININVTSIFKKSLKEEIIENILVHCIKIEKMVEKRQKSRELLA